MPSFNKDLRDKKITYNKCKRSGKGIYKALGVVVFILIAVGLFLLGYLNTNGGITISEQLISTKETITVNNSSSTEGTIGNDTSNVYFALFIRIIKEIFIKLYINLDLVFAADLNELAVMTHIDSMDRIKQIKGIYDCFIDDMKHNEDIAHISSKVLTKRLMYLFQILYVSYGAYEMDGLECVYVSEKPDTHNYSEGNYTTCRFIYQQYHLNIVVETILTLVKQSAVVITKLVEESVDNNPILNVARLLAQELYKTKENLLQIYDGDIELIYNGNNLRIGYLMFSFEEYKQFLILNFYTIYLHIFEINQEYNVIGLSKHFLNVSSEETILNYNNEACSGVFKSFKTKGRAIGENFYQSFGELNRKCKELVYKIITNK
eukprot:GAHX01001959.1.p1 GENE.GAHX01001959.1~~GAHX01001959.1.p1  ORF type:complete len:377 (-),score=55.63 GAHX01001959.1:192-1322(-)